MQSAELQENMDLFCDHTAAVCKVCGNKGITYAIQKCITFLNGVIKHHCGTTVFSLHAHGIRFSFSVTLFMSLTGCNNGPYF